MHRALVLTALLLCLLGGEVSAAPAVRQPRITGKQPPAQAPYAEDDPIPRLSLHPHDRQNTPRDAAESFLYFLSIGFDEAILGHAGGSIGDPRSYDRAWALMAPNRPPLADFKRPWRGTAAMKALQLEPMDAPQRFFVELQRVEWCGDHWATSFYQGTAEATLTQPGWRVSKFDVRPEHLVFSNIGGHQGWQHSAEIMAVWYARMTPPRTTEPWKEPWELDSLRYERRTATAVLRHATAKQVRTIRMARITEGGWLLLSITPKPDALPPIPVP